MTTRTPTPHSDARVGAMARPSLHSQTAGRTGPWNRRSGLALVIVLAILVLITGLALAFFTTATTESVVSKNYANGSQLQQFAEASINVVEAQIRDATAGYKDPKSPAAADVLAWCSQPGLLRTFDTSGNPVKAYKLYSSDNMQVDEAAGAFDPLASLSTEVPTTWSSKPNEFVDLNAPITTVSGTNYPILDPPPDSATDPTAPVGFQNNAASAGVVAGGANPNPAPMPVRWLYQLKNGQLVSYNDLATKASAGNPPVGRMAFWTDDETAKVNINTAAGDEWPKPDGTLPSGGNAADTPGSFWNTPHFSTAFSWLLGGDQPVNKEFQRYPGHPATTYLSAVFPDLTRANLYSLVPRINGGGSNGGTSNTTNTGFTTITPDSDRLYSSVDELMFAPTVNGSGTRNGNNPLITTGRLEKARFFLTANSKAPELNLFNRPRVTIWPVPYAVNTSDETIKRTAFDRLFAFCSTIGGKGYYFQRHNYDSAATPTNPNGYLSETDDYLNIQRNQDLYGYLQTLTGAAIPGFGGNFLAKYPGNGTASDRDQILTEIFDYIRSTNLQEQSESGKTFTTPMTSQNGVGVLYPGSNFVVPIKIGNTRGFGRFPTISEAAIQFYSKSVLPLDGNNKVITTGTSNYYISPSSSTPLPVQALLLFKTFNPSQGALSYWPRYQIRCQVLTDFSVDGSAIGMRGGVNPIDSPVANAGTGDSYGGYEGVNHTFLKPFTVGGTADLKSTADFSYPFVSNQISMTSSTFNFGGGTIAVSIEPIGAPDSSTAYQTIYFKFPTTTLPTPYQDVMRAPGSPPSPPPPPIILPYGPGLTASITTVQRTAIGAGHSGLVPVDDNTQNVKDPTTGKPVTLPMRCLDTIRSMEAKEGDPRIYFPRTTVGSQAQDDFFDAYGAGDPNTSYYNSTWHLAHDLSSGSYYRHRRDINRDPNYSNEERNYGVVVPNAMYFISPTSLTSFRASQYPELPLKWKTSGVLMATGYPGDWDMGLDNSKDGPFINKTDDGTVKWTNSGGVNVPPYFSNQASTESTSRFSPNRILPSPVMFGSLPTGVWTGAAGNAWQTLLFCKNPPAGSNHPGFASPPDHLLLDLFAMPVVEPYALSEPFSCAGRINLNTQIAPFAYIKRDTGLRALLKSTRVSALTPLDAPGYKGGQNFNTQLSSSCHFSIDPDETLKQWDTRYTNNLPFKSASEICDVYLVPQGSTLSQVQDWSASGFWPTHTLTGDNEREKPYSDLYPRLTTKSNSYTVHVRVQTLQAQTNKGAGFKPQSDFTVTGEYRGSYGIERYIDPNDPRLSGVDFATLPLNDPSGVMDKYYNFRVVTVKKFTP